jgi:hypothetical protein
MLMEGRMDFENFNISVGSCFQGVAIFLPIGDPELMLLHCECFCPLKYMIP